jgi:hypothetical protein
MSGQRLKQIAIALVALVFLWGAAELFRGGFDEATTDFELPAVAIEDADTVVFERAADTLVLAKVDGDWRVNGFTASASGVTDFFGVLADAPAGQLVAQNAGTHARLEVEDGVARGLRVRGGGETLVHVLLGKRAAGFQDSYFRYPGEDNVYSVRTRLPSYVDRRLDDWRDRTVARIPAAGVSSVEVHVNRETYELQREGDTWLLAGGGSPDSAVVARLLSQYESLSATGFYGAGEDSVPTFATPHRRTVLRSAAGDTLLELAFDSVATGYWARKTGDSTIFQFSSFIVDRLAPRDSVVRGR